MLLTIVIVECVPSEEPYIVKLKATCYITWQANINAHTSVWYTKILCSI